MGEGERGVQSPTRRAVTREERERREERRRRMAVTRKKRLESRRWRRLQVREGKESCVTSRMSSMKIKTGQIVLRPESWREYPRVGSWARMGQQRRV